jgi:predicted TIM-barrel fold metal-dependent hydrolase
MGFIDAHVHVWTDDTAHYPLAPGHKKEEMKPARFTPQDLFKHTKPAGVDRVVLIQMSYYTPAGMMSRKENGFDNSYMLDMIALEPEVFVGTAVIDPGAEAPEQRMSELAKKGVRAFRIYPGLERGARPIEGAGEGWLRAEGYGKMFAAGARNNQAMSCLINPDALPDLDRMCKKFPDTPVIIDHLCRIGADGTIAERDVDALCGMAVHKKVMVKVGAFYALGKKTPPYTDLGPLIRRVVEAFGARRCMWESDCPFQVEQDKYQDSLDLVRRRLDFLTAEDRDWLLGKTAESFFFRH